MHHNDAKFRVFFDFSKFFKVVRVEGRASALTTMSTNRPPIARGWLIFEQLEFKG